MLTCDSQMSSLQAIHIQLGQHQIVSAVLHVIEMDSTSEDLRARAMNERNPVHSMLFCQQGQLLTANAAALRATYSTSSGDLERFASFACYTIAEFLALVLAPACSFAWQCALMPSIAERSHCHAMHMLRALHAGLAVVCRHVPSIIQHHVPGFVFSRVLRR